MDELDLIARYFAPLAVHPGARRLQDDLAIVQTRGPLAITTDTIVEGVHFLPDDPIETIAKKAVRVNVSDLAAKGARPFAIFLNLAWPATRTEREVAGFARGLEEDLKFYHCALMGGDTTATPGPLTISITALGRPMRRRAPSRADAKPGDDLWVTGAIGDAHLGLKAARGELGELTEHDRDHLLARYRTPAPPLAFAATIARLAAASMDVSDGLLLDANRLAEASEVAVKIDAAAVPHSAPAQRWLETADAYQLRLLSGGDDYEILFTAPPERRAAIRRGATRSGITVTRIGAIAKGAGVSLVDAKGAPLPIPDFGYRHQIAAP